MLQAALSNHKLTHSGRSFQLINIRGRMSSTKKVSQQELRLLMREKAQSKAAQRIESPLAKYDEKGILWCVVCNVVVHSEALWSSHLIEKAHKKKIEELKQLRQSTKISAKGSSNGLKRPASSKLERKVLPTSGSKFNKISEFSKKEILIKQNKTESEESVESEQIADDTDEENQTDNSSIVPDSSLPQDFFDNEVKPTKAPIRSTNNKTVNKTDNINGNDVQAGTLPKGFFDDPLLDAKSRKPGGNFKDPFDKQMELFRREIAQESIVSEVLLEEESEQIQKEKTISEIEEQIGKWEKVDAYQKRMEEIHKRRIEAKSLPIENVQQSDDSDLEEEDFTDVNFWRKKCV